MNEKNPTVGSLRWPITIYKRVDTPDPATSGMKETLELIAETVADIQPTGPIAYFGSINADYDKPVTHRIYTRWLTPFDANFDLTYQINRTLNTPDGRVRTEVYRVWRWMEMFGKLRFIQWDCQIENITSV